MHNFKYLSFLIVIAILAVGCSKEAKDEAAKLEQELSGESQALVDSTPAEMFDSTSVETNEVVEPKVEAPTNMMPKKPDGDGYTVQVAGCEDHDYANHLVKVFTERGYAPYVTSITVENQGYYRVRIGIFANIADAKALQLELNDKYSLDTWIDVTVNSF